MTNIIRRRFSLRSNRNRRVLFNLPQNPYLLFLAVFAGFPVCLLCAVAALWIIAVFAARFFGFI